MKWERQQILFVTDIKNDRYTGEGNTQMALAVFNFESQFLKGNTEICVILPNLPKQETPEAFYGSERKYKVMWLFHGGGGDASDWIRKSSIELYAAENELAIVTISGCNAMYTNWPTFANGMDYTSFFFRELMPLVYGWFPVSEKKEDNFIAGLSMGAAGALKYAITNPERFAGCICLSSCGKAYSLDYVDDGDRTSPPKTQQHNGIANAGGIEKFYYSTDNIRYQLEKRKEEGTLSSLPPVYMSYGEDDHHYEEGLDFKRFAENIGMDLTFTSIPGYKHEWRFWNIGIQEGLKFFGFQSRI